jgi:hypothetical protein
MGLNLRRENLAANDGLRALNELGQIDRGGVCAALPAQGRIRG